MVDEDDNAEISVVKGCWEEDMMNAPSLPAMKAMPTMPTMHGSIIDDRYARRICK